MSQSRLSLLSLSIAAASAAPLAPASPVPDPAARSPQATSRPPDGHHPHIAATTTKHRRLSSAGRSRRRLSDARDAATRPFPTSLQTASASLAALSLSSPTVSHRTQPIQVSQAAPAKGTSELEPGSVDETRLSASPSQSHTSLAVHTTNGTRSARKRGSIFTCESCSKVYRHPSCLIKHRWEHTPQWQEASKFVLSKHQQVQLLEAAAILSHLSPSSASLPEDRSLWPSFLSGGLVPPPASAQHHPFGQVPATTVSALSSPPPMYAIHAGHPISSSVPASTALSIHYAPSASPRSHDHAIGRSEASTVLTHVRPGMLGVHTGTDREGVPMPGQTTEDDAHNLLALRSWGGPTSVPPPSHAHSLSLSSSLAPLPRARERRRSNVSEYGVAHDAWRPGRVAYVAHVHAGWSLPRSSVRSKSGSSPSRSRSGSGSESRSEDEHEDEGVFGTGALRVGLEDEMADGVDRAKVYGSRMRAWKADDGDDGGDGEGMGVVLREDAREYVVEDKVARRVEQTWDGMEMEMEMD